MFCTALVKALQKQEAPGWKSELEDVVRLGLHQVVMAIIAINTFILKLAEFTKNKAECVRIVAVNRAGISDEAGQIEQILFEPHLQSTRGASLTVSSKWNGGISSRGSQESH